MQVELLGNPSAAQYGSDRTYARNVWDLETFHGRLYIGSGNSSNYEPAPNAGPVDVWYYDPDDTQFHKEFVVDDEQIDRYRLDAANDELLIPGHDATESADLGNYYRWRDGRWEKLRTLPGALHVYDIVRFQGDLFAALSTSKGACVGRSADDGKTWTTYCLAADQGPIPPTRAFTLFTLDNQLYVCSYLLITYVGNEPLPGVQKGASQAVNAQIDHWDGGDFQSIPLALFPDALQTKITLVVRPVNFLDHLVYIGADQTNDHQWIPAGLFSASSVDKAERIGLSPGELPYDIVVSSGQCYVLTDTEQQGQYLIRVLASKDLKQWRELLRFSQSTFARSFEILNGDFYFGLGCDTTRTPPETGNILRVSQAQIIGPVP